MVTNFQYSVRTVHPTDTYNSERGLNLQFSLLISIKCNKIFKQSFAKKKEKQKRKPVYLRMFLYQLMPISILFLYFHN